MSLRGLGCAFVVSIFHLSLCLFVLYGSSAVALATGMRVPRLVFWVLLDRYLIHYI